MQLLGAFPGDGHGPAFVVDFKDIDEQLRYLRRVVSKYRGDPQIRNLAVGIVTANAPPRDKRAQAVAIGQWVQDEIFYVHELPERFQLPDETLRLKAADCDDSSVLVASMIESVGIPSALVCMKIDGNWSHMFPGAWIQPGTGGSVSIIRSDPQLLPLDTTMRFPVTDMRNPVHWAIERGKRVSLKVA